MSKENCKIIEERLTQFSQNEPEGFAEIFNILGLTYCLPDKCYQAEIFYECADLIFFPRDVLRRNVYEDLQNFCEDLYMQSIRSENVEIMLSFLSSSLKHLEKYIDVMKYDDSREAYKCFNDCKTLSRLRRKLGLLE